jgi:hypothetical protein
MSSIEPLANGGDNVIRYGLNTPTSDRAVDVLLPTADDTMEITPATVPLLSSGSNSTHHSKLNDDRSTYMPNASSFLGDSQSIPRVDALNDMRGALMDSFQKAVYLRYPDLNIDHDKLKERFVKKLTDAEVQDFIRMGKGVVDDLKRAGRIGEVKRKLASHLRDDESEARRNRRRIYRSPSPLPADDRQSTDRMDVSRHIDLSTPGEGPRASTSKAILADPHPLTSDNHMSMSTIPQQPFESPHSGPYSNPPDSGHHKDVSMSPSNIRESALTTDEQRPSHETKDQDTMAIDDEPSDFRTPRILLAKQGHSTADVLDASFDVSEQLFNATRRWTQSWKHYE